MENFILETRRLRKEFGGFVAVRDLNLRVRSGQIHALIGPNGAGKTTVFNLLTGFLAPTSGQILFDGNDVTRINPVALVRRGVVRSFQISAVFQSMTALENIRISLLRGSGIPIKPWVSQKRLSELDERALELLNMVGLADSARDIAGELPYGRRRALEIAVTISLDPRLVLLDEPTQGMSVEDVGVVTNLIRRVSSGRTVVIVEHNLAVIESLADVVTVLQSGGILAEGSYAEMAGSAEVVSAYLGVRHDN